MDISTQPRRQTIATVVLLTIILTTAIGLFNTGANGIRGTDQYWYLHDVQTLQQGDSPVTNIYYPGNLLRQNGVDVIPNYFLHNGPLLHLVAKVSQPGNAFQTWITLNTICHLLVAASIFFIAIKFTNRITATWTTSFYLVSPIAVWQTLNMLQEQLMAGLVAMILLSYTYKHYIAFQLVLIAALVIGTMTHPLFFILSILYCFERLLFALRTDHYTQAMSALALALMFFITRIYTDHWFPSSFQPNLATIIAGAVPGKTNMMWQFSDTPLLIDTALLTSKLLAAIKAHFFTLRDAPLYIHTNLGLVAAVFLVTFHFRKHRIILLPCLTCLGLYAAIIVLMQTQARYQQIIASASFVLIALCAYELRYWFKKNKLFPLLATGLLMSSVLLSLYMVYTVNKQSEIERLAMTTLRNAFSDLLPDDRILLLDSEYELFLGYTLSPNKVLTIKSNLISSESADKAIGLFNPQYLITTHQETASTIPHTITDRVAVPNMGTFFRLKLN